MYIYIYLWQFLVCLGSYMIFNDRSWVANSFWNQFWARIQFGSLGKSQYFGDSFPIPGKVSDGGFGGQVLLFILGHVIKKTRSVILKRSL